MLTNMKKLTTKQILFYAVPLIVIAFLFAVPQLGNRSLIVHIKLMCLYITLGHMWNLLAGYAGLVSLGQQMYIGLGAYTIAVLTEKLGVPYIPGLIISGAICMVFAIGLSYLLLRMKGMYFSIATWLFAEAMMLVLAGIAYLGKGQGMFLPHARQITSQIPYYAAALLIITMIVVVIVLRSKLGLGLFAIRDDDISSATSGVPQFKSKLYCMMISSFITGVCGSIFYMDTTWAKPADAFGIDWTVRAVFIVVIGGIGTVMGPVIGGIIYVILSVQLSRMPNIGSLNMVILGVIAVAVILLAPDGIVGTLQKRFKFEILSSRRRLK